MLTDLGRLLAGKWQGKPGETPLSSLHPAKIYASIVMRRWQRRGSFERLAQRRGGCPGAQRQGCEAQSAEDQQMGAVPGPGGAGLDRTGAEGQRRNVKRAHQE